MHRERLEAIRDWHLPKYSTGVHVSRDETVQMASRVLIAEASAAEQSHAASQLADAVVRLDAKLAEQAATIERLGMGIAEALSWGLMFDRGYENQRLDLLRRLRSLRDAVIKPERSGDGQ